MRLVAYLLNDRFTNGQPLAFDWTGPEGEDIQEDRGLFIFPMGTKSINGVVAVESGVELTKGEDIDWDWVFDIESFRTLLEEQAEPGEPWKT